LLMPRSRSRSPRGRSPPRARSRSGGRRDDYRRSPPRGGRRYDSPPRGGYGGGRGGRDEPKRDNAARISLLVRNIREGTAQQDIRDLFTKFGMVKDVYVPLDFHTKCAVPPESVLSAKCWWKTCSGSQRVQTAGLIECHVPILVSNSGCALSALSFGHLSRMVLAHRRGGIR